jgi:hypothetical protein
MESANPQRSGVTGKPLFPQIRHGPGHIKKINFNTDKSKKPQFVSTFKRAGNDGKLVPSINSTKYLTVGPKLGA